MDFNKYLPQCTMTNRNPLVILNDQIINVDMIEALLENGASFDTDYGSLEPKCQPIHIVLNRLSHAITAEHKGEFEIYFKIVKLGFDYRNKVLYSKSAFYAAFSAGGYPDAHFDIIMERIKSLKRTTPRKAKHFTNIWHTWRKSSRIKS